MRTELAAFTLFVAAATPTGFSQTAVQPAAGPTFDVVSIKRSATDRVGPLVGSRVNQSPDGGLTMTNVLVGTLIARAYPPTLPADMIGRPAWATSERFDVSATSSLSTPTPDDRIAMLRAMLADRFKLALHFEKREQPAFALLLEHTDGRLGPGMRRVDLDCDARLRGGADAIPDARAPQPQLPDFKTPPPPCTLRTVGALLRDRLGDGQGRLGDLLEGEATMAALATTLRQLTGRFVVDRTGLPGTYRVAMNFDMVASLRGPDIAAGASTGLSVFTAIREQLGLRLESSRAERDTLVIDRLERPTEN